MLADSQSDEDAAAAMAAEEAAAEEAAAAAVGEAAEDEDEDDADAHDEDADSARLDQERRHPLTNLPPPADDVDIAHAFTVGPNAAKKIDADVLTLGEQVKAAIAFASTGRSKYHVWGVMGSINMENKFSTYVQNFTYSAVNKTVAPQSELSFSYRFTPNERLDPRSFQLALTVFYEAQGHTGNAIRGHSTTFFNSTVATVAGPETMSNGLFLFILAFSVAAAAAAIYAYRNMEGAKPASAEMGTEESSKNEWLEDHHNLVNTGGGRAKTRHAGKK